MIRLSTLKIRTRYIPGRKVYWIDGDGGRPTIRRGTIFEVEVAHWNGPYRPEVLQVGIHEDSLTREYFPEVSTSRVFLCPRAAARVLAEYNSEVRR
jgi:hypothetical protein